jgi:hypothetical protein
MRLKFMKKIESTVHDIVVTRPATVVCEIIGKK